MQGACGFAVELFVFPLAVAMRKPRSHRGSKLLTWLRREDAAAERGTERKPGRTVNCSV